MSPTREMGFFGVSGMSLGSVLPAVTASGAETGRARHSGGRNAAADGGAVDTPGS